LKITVRNEAKVEMSTLIVANPTESLAAGLSSALTNALQGQESDFTCAASTYNESVIKVLDEHAPLKLVHRKQVPLKPWYSDVNHNARRKRRQLERKLQLGGWS